MFNRTNHKDNLFNSIMFLIESTSTELPLDVSQKLGSIFQNEEENSNAQYALRVISENRKLAKKNISPLCQDTGTINFYLKGKNAKNIENILKEAVIKSTEKGILRQNSVDSITGTNTGTNIGIGHPAVYYDETGNSDFEIRLMLKGGGCENVGAQYALPYTSLNAGRDLEGVKKVALDAVKKALGKGCSPGILGICIGGDRASGYVQSKKEFLRNLDDKNISQELSQLEIDIVREANKLGIGPMGFGGKTTLLGVKVGHLNRLPASYFVSISYMCWAFRRQGIVLDKDMNIKKWIYR